jgi:hypothetical protein
MSDTEVKSSDLVGLSDPQKRALGKLTNEWECAYTIGESMNTLDALCKKGLALHSCDRLGASFSPRTANKYKLPNDLA